MTLTALLMFEPRLCTLYELQTQYSLEDFYDFLEMIDMRKELDRLAKARADQNK